jgi:TATA-binding protein-associated factor
MQKADPDLCLKVVNSGFLLLLSHHAQSSQKQITVGEVSQTWSVRHAALIGLKYWMAVRQDLLDKVLMPLQSGKDSPAFLAIVDGYFFHSDFKVERYQ